MVILSTVLTPTSLDTAPPWSLGTGLLCLFLPITLWCSARKILLKEELCLVYLTSIQMCMNKSLRIVDNLERLFYLGVFLNGSKIHRIFAKPT